MRRFMLLTVFALGATAARAENGLFYVGAGVTNSSLTASELSEAVDLKNTSWKAFVGVRPLKWLAVEADYIDLGSGRGGTIMTDTYTSTESADSSAWAAYALGFLPLPLPMVDFYGKLGVARWKLKEESVSQANFYPPGTSIYEQSYSGTDLAWGIGVQTHVKIFGARLEYEGFYENISGTGERQTNPANIVSVSVFLNF